MESDRYAEEWNSLFPRFAIAAALFAAVELFLEQIPILIGPLLGAPAPTTNIAFYAQTVSLYNIAMVPFGLFLLFYLAARVRVNLSTDYAGIAASIFLGTLVAFHPVYLAAGLAGGLGNPAIETLIQWAGSSVAASVEHTFIGFSAILLSYYRRM